MKFFKYFLIASFLSIILCNSQTVMNSETLRVDMLKGEEHWAGSASLNFNITKNTNNIFAVSTNVGVGYNGDKNLWMIISNLNFIKLSGEAFANSGSQHFRYNRKSDSSIITFEAFLQGQYDKISNISFRGLGGFGARFDLSKKKDPNNDKKNRPRFFLGALVMHEYENSSEFETNIIQKDRRSSNYLSFTLPYNGVKIVSTTYYQPKMNLLKDYRLSSDLIMNIKFPKKEASVREPNAKELHDIMIPESNSF